MHRQALTVRPFVRPTSACPSPSVPQLRPTCSSSRRRPCVTVFHLIDVPTPPPPHIHSLGNRRTSGSKFGRRVSYQDARMDHSAGRRRGNNRISDRNGCREEKEVHLDLPGDRCTARPILARAGRRLTGPLIRPVSPAAVHQAAARTTFFPRITNYFPDGLGRLIHPAMYSIIGSSANSISP